MSKYVNKHISLPKEIVEELEKYSRVNGVAQSHVISFALNYLFKHEGRDYPRIEELIGNVIEEKISHVVSSLNEVKQATNNVGVDSKILIEFLNSHYLENPDLKIHSSDSMKSPQLITADEFVRKRIAKQRQKKLSD